MPAEVSTPTGDRHPPGRNRAGQPGTYDDTSYTYTATGKPLTETDNAGNNWSWSCDQLGERVDQKDPDTGETTTAYDPMGHITKVTDAEQRQITTTYDNDGRKTGLYDTSSTQTLSTTNKLAGWTYDTVMKGLPTAAISYSRRFPPPSLGVETRGHRIHTIERLPPVAST
jgi:YD repeat-containing protein